MNTGAAHLTVALMGTRGVPARYGGFETAVEEIGKRLAARGHTVTVYCRTQPGTERVTTYEGMTLVHLPALRSKAIETLSHTALSTLHAIGHRRHDAMFLFNAANAPFIAPLQWRGMRVAVHVDGLEWRRGKWGRSGRAYYRRAEALSVRRADALIADAPGIADYYGVEFGASTEQIAYGAPILTNVGDDRLAEMGLAPGRFHLVVARFEPENNLEMIVRGYRASNAVYPLVVVGTAPYADEYLRAVHAIGEVDPRIQFAGAVWDQQLLDQLYANALLYLHGHSIGGTNPSLLRAAGAGAAVAAYDVRFNRDVLGDEPHFFDDEKGVVAAVEHAELHPDGMAALGTALQARMQDRYDWDAVTDRYEELAQRLAARFTRRGEVSGRRTGTW